MSNYWSYVSCFFLRGLEQLEVAVCNLQDGFLIGAHHGLELEDVDRVCELLIAPHVEKVNRLVYGKWNHAVVFDGLGVLSSTTW